MDTKFAGFTKQLGTDKNASKNFQRITSNSKHNGSDSDSNFAFSPCESRPLKTTFDKCHNSDN